MQSPPRAQPLPPAPGLQLSTSTLAGGPGDMRTPLAVYGLQLSDHIPARSSSEINCTERCCCNRRATTLSTNAPKHHPLHPLDPERCLQQSHPSVAGKAHLAAAAAPAQGILCWTLTMQRLSVQQHKHTVLRVALTPSARRSERQG